MLTAVRISPGCTCDGLGRAPSTCGHSTYLHSTTNDRDLRPQPLVKRQARLEALLERFGCPAVSLSEPFEDGLALLRVAEERGLEGIVSKRRDAPYRSGECRDWRKVKTPVWRVPLGTVATIRTRWSAQGLMASMNEYVSTV